MHFVGSYCTKLEQLVQWLNCHIQYSYNIRTRGRHLVISKVSSCRNAEQYKMPGTSDEERENFIFFWRCISLQILANNKLDALFHVFIYFISLRVSSITVLIIRRSNCINTSSCMISLCKWLLGMPARRPAYQAVTYTD